MVVGRKVRGGQEPSPDRGQRWAMTCEGSRFGLRGVAGQSGAA
jgi:hypothetical protein